MYQCPSEAVKRISGWENGGGGRLSEFGEFNTACKNLNARRRLNVWFGNHQPGKFWGEPGSHVTSTGERRGGEGQRLRLCLWEGGGGGNVRNDQIRSWVVGKLTLSLGECVHDVRPCRGARGTGDWDKSTMQAVKSAETLGSSF